MASKRNVKYIEQNEPSFLKKFKERVGYKEPTNINDKFCEETDNSQNDSNNNELEDEQPVIVVLKQGDLSAEEVAKLKKENDSTDCWDSKNDKPIFKKPCKRSSNEKDVKKNHKKKKTDVKAVKDSKLLSFDEEDEG